MASREQIEVEKKNVASRFVGADGSVGNGAQQGFTTGATRSTSEGKVDYEGHLNPEVLAVFGAYMHAHRVQRDGQLRASDNWQQGIPLYRYVKSLIRHTFEFWRMWRGTPVLNPDSESYFRFREVLSAMLFNTMGIIFEATRKYPWLLDGMHVEPWRRVELETEDAPKPLAGATQSLFRCPQDGEANCCSEKPKERIRCREIADNRLGDAMRRVAEIQAEEKTYAPRI